MSLSSLHSIKDYLLEDLKMSRRRGKDYDYIKLAPKTDNGFVDAQFQGPGQQVPWKSIILASLLLIAGTFLLVIGTLLHTGHIAVENPGRMWPILILGTLMFIPGAYHIRIAYFAYKNVPGYSFDDIPEFE